MTVKSFLPLCLTLWLSAGLLIWLSQNSINAYWQQTYHQDSPLTQLDSFKLWTLGAQWQNTVNDYYAQIQTKFTPKPEPLLTQDPLITEEAKSIALTTPLPTTQPQPIINEQVAPETSLYPPKVSLHTGDKVLFAGDSLMQGVAPFAQRDLKKQYNIESLDLSKQSTGLSYPKFFDWPKTIADTLSQNTDIRLLVIFLGPNDPWDIPNPQGGRYLKFKSPEWQAEYARRVQQILHTAQNHNVRVIWLGIPFMKSDKLNQQMRFLDQLIADNIASPTIWLPTATLLSNGQNTYSDSVNINGKMIRYRSKDGIHFTPEAQRLLALKILEQIQFQADLSS